MKHSNSSRCEVNKFLRIHVVDRPQRAVLSRVGLDAGVDGHMHLLSNKTATNITSKAVIFHQQQKPA